MKDVGQLRKSNPTVLGRFLNKATPPKYPRKQRETMTDFTNGEERVQAIYLFPELDVCRNHWDKNFFEGEWILENTEKSSPAPF